MNNLVKTLYRKKKSLAQAKLELDLDSIDETELYKELDTCSFCFMWYRLHELEEDNSGFPACPTCLNAYGY